MGSWQQSQYVTAGEQSPASTACLRCQPLHCTGGDPSAYDVMCWLAQLVWGYEVPQAAACLGCMPQYRLNVPDNLRGQKGEEDGTFGVRDKLQVGARPRVMCTQRPLQASP